MKKIKNIILIVFGLMTFSSCVYTDDDFAPRPIYYTLGIDVQSYTQFGNTINIDFYSFTTSGRDYYFLLVERPFGDISFNGRRWVKVSDDFWLPPVRAYVDYINIFPNRNYRCVIMSSWGNYSQEFNMYVY